MQKNNVVLYINPSKVSLCQPKNCTIENISSKLGKRAKHVLNNILSGATSLISEI